MARCALLVPYPWLKLKILFHQVQQWLGNEKDPRFYGWELKGTSFSSSLDYDEICPEALFVASVQKTVDPTNAAAERLESNAQIYVLVVTVVRMRRKLMAMSYQVTMISNRYSAILN